MNYSIQRIAKATKRSEATIYRLVKAGHLKGVKEGKSWTIEIGSINEAQMFVAKHVKRTYRKARRKNINSNSSSDLVRFLSLGSKVSLLLELGEKYSEEELKLLLNL